jgi:hypothetical protein
MLELARTVAVALNDEWTLTTSEIKEAVTIKHKKFDAEIRFRFVLVGTHEGTVKIFGRLCGNLINYNPVFNDIYKNGDTKLTTYVNPQRTAEAIAKDVQRKIATPLLEIVKQAEAKRIKAYEQKLRILGDEERLITASYNQLQRVGKDGVIAYNDRRGRSVSIGVGDPQVHAGNIEIHLNVDADEAEMILHELFGLWQSYKHPDMKRTKRK